MSYPFDGVTYLEKIQSDKDMLVKVEDAYYVLRAKKLRDENRQDIELSLEEQFSLLAEAFCLSDECGTFLNDDYIHFMRDVLDCLLKREYSPWADKEGGNESEV